MLGQREKNRTIYPRQLKIRVAEEVVSGLKGPTEASRDYGIPIETIRPWVRKYRNLILAKETKEFLPLDSMKKSKHTQDADLEKKVRELEDEIMRLRKDLHHSKLKEELLNKLIELAERTYGIGVRKNSGAKQ
jgi:transposase-like protein